MLQNMDEDTIQNLLPAPVEGEMGETFRLMSDSHKRLRVPRSPGFSRQNVVNAFHDAFQLIGGVPRLAHWAHENPSEFYRLYGKLLPSSAQKEVSHSGAIEIIHSIAPGALDGVTVDAEVVSIEDYRPTQDQELGDPTDPD